MFECNMVMENKELREMTGQENLLFPAFSFNLDIVTAYRQSVSDDGDLEDYTVIYTEFGDTWCIDVPFDEFNYTYKKYIDDNKTV